MTGIVWNYLSQFFQTKEKQISLINNMTHPFVKYCMTLVGNFAINIYSHIIYDENIEFYNLSKEATMANSYGIDKKGVRIDYTTLTPRFSVTNNDSLNDGINYLNEHGYASF